MASRFKVSLATTCGEEPVEVVSVSAEGELDAKWPAPATLYIDREGVGSFVSVSVGAIVPDGAVTKVLVGACPTARDIRIEDAVVGQLGASTIVDAKGGHCYEVLTSGFPSARLESKRVYERPLELFLPTEIPADKVVLRRCEQGSGSFAALMGAAPTATQAPPATIGAFTANPLSKSNKPPPAVPTKPATKPPKKPRHGSTFRE